MISIIATFLKLAIQTAITVPGWLPLLLSAMNV